MSQAAGTAWKNKPELIGCGVDGHRSGVSPFCLEEIPKQEYFVQVDTLISYNVGTILKESQLTGVWKTYQILPTDFALLLKDRTSIFLTGRLKIILNFIALNHYKV